MKHIWSYIQNKSWDSRKKSSLFLTLTTSICAAAGLLVWFFLHFFALNKISWAICFAGYPGFIIGLIGGCLYLYNHKF